MAIAYSNQRQAPYGVAIIIKKGREASLFYNNCNYRANKPREFLKVLQSNTFKNSLGLFARKALEAMS